MEEQINIQQKESIKLIKNTKGYNWEIKLFPLVDGAGFMSPDLERLEKINSELDKKYCKEVNK